MRMRERRELERARRAQRAIGWHEAPDAEAAAAAVRQAERGLAASRGQQFAEVIDLGVHWSTGAPLPHIVSDGSRTQLLCRANQPSPEWDGTNPVSISPSDRDESAFIEMVFYGCASIRFGMPGDEGQAEHPLYGRGFEYYNAHIVRNSSWIAELDRIAGAHPRSRGSSAEKKNHYLLAFQDNIFEAVAERVDAGMVRGTLGGLLTRGVVSFASSP
jgi:hypothetical protein